MTCENCKCSKCNPKIIYPAKDLDLLVKQAKENLFSNDQEGLDELQEALSGQGRREYFIWSLIYQQTSVKDFINSFESLLLFSHPDQEIEISWCDFYDLTVYYLFEDEQTRNKILGALMMM